MMDYLITCTTISFSVWLASIFLKNAPARISFYLLMFALFSWFIPWQLIPDTFAAKVRVDAWLDMAPFSLQGPVISTQAEAGIGQIHAAQTHWLQQFTWEQLLTAAFFVGSVVFLLRLWKYQARIKLLNKSVIHCQSLTAAIQTYPVKVTELNTPAIATGLFKPTIWVDYQLLQRPELGSVLLHEATHIRQGDIIWLWLICLTESLFWWNPICLKLSENARQLLELSCDERCFQQLQQKYQFDLASLLLNPLAGSSKQSLVGMPILNVVNNKDFNMLRVKMLNKEKVMKIKHLVILMAAVSVSAVAAAQISESKAAEPVKQTAQSAKKVNLSEAFKAQQAALLQAAAKAKSQDPADLKQVVANITDWQDNRTELTWREEEKMKLNAFMLLAHVQHKLGQYQDVITRFEAWYPAGSDVPFFLRNFTASTYLKLNNPDFALKELAILQQAIGDDIRPGSLYMLALAYTEKADYAEAIKVLSHPNVLDNQSTRMLRYYIYSQQNDVITRDQVKASLPKDIASKPATLPEVGIPGSPLLHLLSAT
ncbi:MAG: peptidase M56 BlaR1 [Gammaproteobacteria bacterium]|nr:peptidase M56 BlaR1 [Gammaproteobacteria bacterium]MBU2058480.1 peptidase M56 BlaR1 [Gammaproteobacteria bacterium]MBU2176467.1 peptidase M56 BlaR1 [Gammaproteobacteria bacterium]MBU2248591.1 peptidase M56 BlaR1 [Gammaproteobacteria bacterium]MBU2345546.1 peptidase M56 BlaR1 [Gammaproteobacteria bacterium]